MNVNLQTKSAAAMILLAALPVASSFGLAPNSNIITTSPLSPSPSTHTSNKFHQQIISPQRSSSSISPLFVASSQDINGTSDPTNNPVIKSIDAEMEKMKKNRDDLSRKLAKFEQGLTQLEQKKQQYLEGIDLGKPPVGGNFSETTLRSAVKAFMWRIVAGSVTLITSLKFSGSIATALQIVGSDFFSKAATMFIGERLMNKSQAGRKTGKDSTGRSVAKALIWRLFAICNTLTVTFFFTGGDLKMASKIAGSDAFFKTGLMVAYERFWARVEWGKEYNIEFSI